MHSEELRLAGYPEPLGLWLRSAPPPEAYPDLRVRRFELSSRGDRVPGRLLLPPEGRGPFPLVLLQHGVGGSKESPYLDASGGPWARRGLAVACIDFPLHGARADHKIAALLPEGREPRGPGATLVFEFARQAVIDLEHTLDALATLDEIDGERIAYAGFSMGALLGAAFCALDPRPRAVALALGGAELGPAALDASLFLPRIAPRPVLLVNALGDERVSRAAAEALFAAAREPREQLWFDGTHDHLPGAALKAMWEFLARHLEAL